MRSLTTVNDLIDAVETSTVAEDLPGWLQRQAAWLGAGRLLAHADDGVIWGLVDERRCVTVYDAAQGQPAAASVGPPLRAVTLQSARLFNESGEVLLWRSAEAGWQARLIRAADSDETALLTEAFEEDQILWGNRATALGGGEFALFEEGARGLRQVVPLVPGGERLGTRRLRLRIRHYLTENENGLVRVSASRLVKLWMEDT